jgi:hypothetical protein
LLGCPNGYCYCEVQLTVGPSPRQGGSGGGAVILHTPGTVRVTGTGGVSADGGLGGDERPGDTGVAGAGAGGSVLITAGALEVEEAASVSAVGGAASTGSAL